MWKQQGISSYLDVEDVGKDLILMCMNDEVLELSGKGWKWMDIKCRKHKWIMLRGSSRHIPKSLINKKLMIFYFKFYLRGIFDWHGWNDLCWS